MEEELKEVLSRKESAVYLHMSQRNLSRMIRNRIIPYLRTHFSVDPLKGRIYFSKKRLDAWERKGDEVLKEFPKTKDMWIMTFGAEIEAEEEERMLATKIIKLGERMIFIRDKLEEVNLTEKERAKLNREFSRDFEDYQDSIIELKTREKKRIHDFFNPGEEEEKDKSVDEMLYREFPDLFSKEIEEKRRAEADKKRLSGRYPLEAPTLKPKKKKQQQVTTIEQADEVSKK